MKFWSGKHHTMLPQEEYLTWSHRLFCLFVSEKHLSGSSHVDLDWVSIRLPWEISMESQALLYKVDHTPYSDRVFPGLASMAFTECANTAIAAFPDLLLFLNF